MEQPIQEQPLSLSDVLVVDNKKEEEVNTNGGNNEEKEYEINWLGGEKILLGRASVEENGVNEILKSLSAEDEDYIKNIDTTIPIRFLRAEKGNITKAIDRIRSAIQWRKDMNIDQYRFDFISANINDEEIDNNNTDDDTKEQKRIELMKEFDTGYLYIRGYDKDGRGILNIHPTVVKTGNYDNMILLLLYQLEKVIACTKRKSIEIKKKSSTTTTTENHQPLEKFIFIGDYSGFSKEHRTPISILNEVFTLFHKYYPERIYCAYILNPPLLISTILMIVRPFLDPITRQKIQSCYLNLKTNQPDKVLQQFIDHLEKPSQFETCYTGMITNNNDNNDNTIILPYDAKEYYKLPFDVAFDELE